jgi:4-alpha-glucanotransferase
MPFPRSSGVLLHPTSLPGRFGIGDLGPSAFEFVNYLGSAGQRIWQVLPLGPTGYGDSPYQSFSAFAGNPLLISLDVLVDEGLLGDSEMSRASAFAPGVVDYEQVIAHRRELWPQLLDRFEAGGSAIHKRFDQFCRAQAAWLDDFALFMAVKDAHEQVAWTKWDADIAVRQQTAITWWSKHLEREVRVYKLTQFIFFEQWARLRAHCRKQAIEVLGDLPIFAAHDSADVWAHREFFRLNATGQPTVVAGVPPDYFSATGQLWGNPHYDWKRLERNGFSWWIDRIRTLLTLVDRVRLDHFRGFVASWEVAGDATTAIQGEWKAGPGASLFEAIQQALNVSPLPFVAENLGVITPEVEALRRQFGFPGMAILQFAFGTDPQAPDFRPHNYAPNLVVYTGTHDNDTTMGWWTGDAGHSTRSAEDITRERDYARRYLRIEHDVEVCWDLIRAALASVADTAIIPAQDLLGLGSEARMNQPGTASGNWRWRLLPGQLTADTARRLALLTETYERTLRVSHPS